MAGPVDSERGAYLGRVRRSGWGRANQPSPTPQKQKRGGMEQKESFWVDN